MNTVLFSQTKHQSLPSGHNDSTAMMRDHKQYLISANILTSSARSQVLITRQPLSDTCGPCFQWKPGNVPDQLPRHTCTTSRVVTWPQASPGDLHLAATKPMNGPRGARSISNKQPPLQGSLFIAARRGEMKAFVPLKNVALSRPSKLA